jgi:fumarate reductase subunit C
MSRELTRPLPRTWWLARAAYTRFMVRELTSVAVFAYTLVLIWALWSAGDGGSFSTFFSFLHSPWSVMLHILVLGLALYHTVTWIALTPKVLVLWRDDEQVDPRLIIGANALLFLLLSGVVAWVVLR